MQLKRIEQSDFARMAFCFSYDLFCRNSVVECGSFVVTKQHNVGWCLLGNCREAFAQKHLDVRDYNVCINQRWYFWSNLNSNPMIGKDCVPGKRDRAGDSEAQSGVMLGLSLSRLVARNREPLVVSAFATGSTTCSQRAKALITSGRTK